MAASGHKTRCLLAVVVVALALMVTEIGAAPENTDDMRIMLQEFKDVVENITTRLTRLEEGMTRCVKTIPTAEQCTRAYGFCAETGDRCNGALKILHNDHNDHCTCCIPERCTGGDGVSLKSGDRCNGTLEILHYSYNDQCTYCVPVKLGCPDEFFMLNGSAQCFKMFKDRPRDYEEGKNKCVEEGLHLAEPADAIALILRKYLMDTSVPETPPTVWLGAQRNGSNFRWERSGAVIASSNPLWWPDELEDDTSSHCMGMLGDEYAMNEHPTHPYAPYNCAWYIMTLCELDMQ